MQSAAEDVRLFIDHLEAVHPNPWHDFSETRFEHEAARVMRQIDALSRDERTVALMRLTALLGTRDGHTGVFPLDPTHDTTLHLYPLRLYEFRDGFFVVDSIGMPELVGARVVAIAARPIEQVATAVRPLVPADNELSRKARLPQYMIVAEVLRGLAMRRSEFELALSDGELRRLTLEPVTAADYSAAFNDLFHPMVPQGLPSRPVPLFLAHRLEDQFVTTLERGRTVYAAYNVSLGDTTDMAEEVLRRARRPRVDRVVLDLRHNPGGDNTTYAPLLEALSRPVVESVYLLIGRTTFSAAGNFIADLERLRDVVFVGEPSGASPNLYGDRSPVALPATGLTAHVATVYWEKGGRGDPRVSIEPDIPVDLSSADFFAGRDPVLEAALGESN